MSNPLQFGLVGHNIHYSLSPRIFDAIGTLSKRAIIYELIDTDTDSLTGVLNRLRTGSLNGLSVTVPYKEALADHCDQLTDVSRDLGATNSLRFDNNVITGDNTDVVGIAQTLRPHAGLLTGGEAMIVGNGGSALAVAYVLIHTFGVRRFLVVGRSTAKLDSFCGRLRTFRNDIDIRSTVFSSGRIESHSLPPLVVNCTPLGGFNHPEFIPFAENYQPGALALYFDLNYNASNKNVEFARASGAVAVDGRTMLVVQAVESYKRWTGYSVAPEHVYEAVFDTHMPV